MLLDDHKIALLQAPYTSIWAGSCAADDQAEVIRLSGATVQDDRQHINLFVPERYTRAFISNVGANPHISFLFASIQTFESYQVKGLFISQRPCTSEEVTYQRNYMHGFAQSMHAIRIKTASLFEQYLQEPCLCIEMRGEEMYEQTPKVGTGNKIG
ncbi:hypothetical protein CLV24_13146 [Pontibacter ummariensis]|uniref:Pyridoxamine 5'-phosphate oxidase n=1 Tax=Pontibacter ummariensis TaxID=1610492 RepID=A0A239KUG6_9BACT|nr:hypothetical protein [Pontibacter ummariensis]PRY05029.1 hypothetical protein CLV24_13146 [Pontibacter ummariensis]SNT21392.1 hypothetical protein SAMN06296052_13146 [Pontibacter ummariensis]